MNNELVLHDVYDHGVGRLDCDNEDIFTDSDDTIFDKNDPDTIDVSCVSMTPNTREKQVKSSLITNNNSLFNFVGFQLAVLESTLTKESLNKLNQIDITTQTHSKPILRQTDRTSNEF